MTADQIITTTVTSYLALCILSLIVFNSMSFTGSDPAGNGMEQGLTFLFGLAFLAVLAIAVMIGNYFFLKDVTSSWVKFYYFAPVVMPVLILVTNFR